MSEVPLSHLSVYLSKPLGARHLPGGRRPLLWFAFQLLEGRHYRGYLVKRFRGGLVFKSHRLCVPLNSRLESNKEEEEEEEEGWWWLAPRQHAPRAQAREFFIDNLLVRIHFIIEMIRRTGLAPWEFEFPGHHVLGG